MYIAHVITPDHKYRLRYPSLRPILAASDLFYVVTYYSIHS